MRRLFSTFAHGRPGVGLLLMRLAAGATITIAGITNLSGGLSFATTSLQALALAAGILLTLGLWTPLAGAILAIVQLWSLFTQPGDPSTRILLMALGAGLALVGPGAWSIDARLFGWKRLKFRDHDS